jgi:anthranilate synthase/phosphoribosyltransferase
VIAVIDNYDSFTYNLVQYLGELGADVRVYRNDAVSVADLDKLAPAGLVISPGPGGPESAGISLEAVRAFSDRIPILGVCLGHQCIGDAFGGKVVHARTLMHGKTSQIRHDGKGIFSLIENPMTATRYHSLALERESLPPVLEVCAESEDGEVMGIRHSSRPVFGVQFHPESILTQYGMRILENFLTLIGPRQPVRLCFGNMREAISEVASGKDLTPDGMRDAMNMIMEGEATPAQISSFLSCLAMKGETTAEIAAAVEVMRRKATRITAPPGEPLLDTCGTGGDRSGTFNISTTVAFVAAGAGIRVAKHGNRSVTSRSGSADVLESLGMNLRASSADVQRALDQAGITFLFAPMFHAAMKYAIGPRREIGIRTIFNILGPLSNPAGANCQVVGVYSEELGLRGPRDRRNGRSDPFRPYGRVGGTGWEGEKVPVRPEVAGDRIFLTPGDPGRGCGEERGDIQGGSLRGARFRTRCGPGERGVRRRRGREGGRGAGRNRPGRAID